MVRDRIVRKLMEANLWKLLMVAVALSVIVTALADIIIGFVLIGEVTMTSLIRGTLFAFFVSAIVGGTMNLIVSHFVKQMKETQIELEESNKLKELFADILSHDIINPLVVAGMYTEVLLDTKNAEEMKPQLKGIQGSINRVLELVDNASKLSRIEGYNKIEFEPMDLKKITDDVLESYEAVAAKAGLDIENRISGPLHIKANIIIADVIENYISNAIKYGKDGKKIVVDSEENGNSLVIKVTDFGPGVRIADKAEIFERFQRMQKGAIVGTGLGLAIVKRIVDLHHGRAWVEHNPEGGSIFCVSLPKDGPNAS